MFDAWRDREVVVLGLGRSGSAAVRLLRQYGVPVYVSDRSADEALEPVAAELRRLGADVDVGTHDLGRIGLAAHVIVSPGIPPEAPPLVAAREAGVPVSSEIDLAAMARPEQRTIVVTGTNGKTTTTALTAHLLEAAGFRATAAGNIGLPLSAVALEDQPYDWVAVEVSSFQLHDTTRFVPTVGVLTNLSPDHLDRYASLAEYYADKALLFRNANPDSTWVLNADDAEVMGLAWDVAGVRRTFSVRERADAWYDRSEHTLVLHGDPLLPRAHLRLLGDHNVANALAASLAVATAGAAPAAIARGLGTFRALSHRLEPVREVSNVLWINDSKATNVASTRVALQAMDRPFVLLLGGRHKGEPYTALLDGLDRCRTVIAFGEARAMVEHDLAGSVPVSAAGTFEEVLAQARRLARPGDAVLLTPACSSFDMFRNYEERGATFRRLVEEM